MAGGVAKSGSKGAGAGKASPAALFEDDPKVARRANFDGWKRKRRPNQMISYDKSPSPLVKRY